MQEYTIPVTYNWQTASHRAPIIYKAIITQTGTAAPVATILENSLNTNVIWTRSGVGVYKGSLEGGEFNTPTFVLATIASPGAFLIYGNTANSDIIVSTKDAAGVAVDLVGTAYIEVQVYI
jgi:hypothetical protein